MLCSVFWRAFFFMGQLSALATAAIRRSLSSFSIVHSSSMCSAVWLSFPRGQFGASMIFQTSCTPLCWGGHTKQQTRTNHHIFLQTITLSPNSLASLGFTAVQPQVFFHVIAVCYPLPTHTVTPVPLLISKNKNLKEPDCSELRVLLLLFFCLVRWRINCNVSYWAMVRHEVTQNTAFAYA